MDENKRGSARFDVFLCVEQIEREAPRARILNLSSNGLLVRSAVCAGEGGIFHASFRVHPGSGESRVSIRGTVVHSRHDGEESEYGIKIEGFGSPSEEDAYRTYVRELAERAESSKPKPPKENSLRTPSKTAL